MYLPFVRIYLPRIRCELLTGPEAHRHTHVAFGGLIERAFVRTATEALQSPSIGQQDRLRSSAPDPARATSLLYDQSVMDAWPSGHCPAGERLLVRGKVSDRRPRRRDFPAHDRRDDDEIRSVRPLRGRAGPGISERVLLARSSRAYLNSARPATSSRNYFSTTIQ